MTVGWAGWLGLIGGILGLAGLAGATFAVLRSSLTKSTIALYQENTKAQSERIDVLEDALEAEKQARAADVMRLELALTASEDQLRTMRTAYEVLVESLRVSASRVPDTTTTITTATRPSSARTKRPPAKKRR